MGDQPDRGPRQDADLNQTNNQKTDQANTQDASHQSNPRQEVAIRSGHQSQVDEQRVTVTVQNQLAAAGSTGGQLAGRVLDATGDVVPGCAVEVFFGPPVGVPVALEETDALGRFQVPDLPPGFYCLRVVAPDESRALHWNLRVDAGSACRATVFLPGPVEANSQEASPTSQGVERRSGSDGPPTRAPRFRGSQRETPFSSDDSRVNDQRLPVADTPHGRALPSLPATGDPHDPAVPTPSAGGQGSDSPTPLSEVFGNGQG